MDTTQALFLHLDEELTNNRPGRIRSNYTVEELAFWLQFYSLFYDRIFVPANFLTDSNLMPNILRKLNVSNPNSTLCADDSSFGILWDVSRFPYETFQEMLKAEGNEPYVTMRNNKVAQMTAHLCDSYLRNRIVRADMTVHLDPLESVEQLRREVFSPALNQALDAGQLERLNECLDAIVSREAQVGYGRSFYYSVFGYGNSPKEHKLAGQFADIVRKYEPLRHQFLMGVDYVSHRLKAKFASMSGATGGQLEILLPPEYLRVVRRPDKSATLASGLGQVERTTLIAAKKYRYLISFDSVIGMTANQLSELHDSDAYNEYKIAWLEFRNQRYDPGNTKPGEILERCLDDYLDQIAATLNPYRRRVDKAINGALQIIPQVISTVSSFSLSLLLQFPGAEEATKAVELVSASIREPLLSGTTRRNTLPFHSFQPSEDTTVYLSESD